MRSYLLLACCLLLTACATTDAQTPGQRYFGLKQDYLTALTIATEYSTACHATPTPVCINHVRELQGIDKKIAPVIKAADIAWVSKDTSKLNGYLDALSILLANLKTHVE